MSWEKSSADLIDLFLQTVPAGPNIQHRKLFGFLCAFVNGNLFTGLFQQSMIFRLSPADRAAFLDQPDTAGFEPMPGHRMTGYVLYRHPFNAPEAELANWMKCSLEFASRLPPKEKKSAKTSAAGKAATTARKKVARAKAKTR